MFSSQKLVSKSSINKIYIRNGDHYRKSGSSNPFVASLYYIAELKIMKLVKEVKILSPYRKN